MGEASPLYLCRDVGPEDILRMRNRWNYDEVRSWVCPKALGIESGKLGCRLLLMGLGSWLLTSPTLARPGAGPGTAGQHPVNCHPDPSSQGHTVTGTGEGEGTGPAPPWQCKRDVSQKPGTGPAPLPRPLRACLAFYPSPDPHRAPQPPAPARWSGH